MSDNIPEFSVTELSGKVKKTVEDAFGYVRVRGELGRVTKHGSGHVYLDLKDDRASLASVIWKGVAGRLKIAPEQGMEVIATGRLTTFAGQSKYQMVIERLEPAGTGALMALFEERKKRLEGEGLFDPTRKKPLPLLPKVIGVVTSPTGAVIRDILHRLRDRFPSHVVVWPTAVQGERAASQIIAAIKGFNGIAPGGDGPLRRPDVLIVARGGGSLEDLWCFNDEGVARAVVASDIPLISAVGHETDTTLIDFVSDRRAPTPSAAAEMAVPVRSEMLQNVGMLSDKLATGMARIAEQRAMALTAAGRGLGRPETLVDSATQRLDRATDRLDANLRRLSAAAQSKFDAANAALRPARIKDRAAHAAEALRVASRQLHQAPQQRIRLLDGRLQGLRLPRRSLKRRVSDGDSLQHGLGERLARAIETRLSGSVRMVSDHGRLLSSYSYRGVLDRGFALVMGTDGNVIRRGKTANAGDRVTIRFADGDRQAVVDATAPTGKPKKKPAPLAEKPQTTLFD